MRPDAIIVAAEPSGDALGAALFKSLKRLQPDIAVEGLGGETMRAAGLPSDVSMDGLAILGFIEGLKAYRHVLKKVRDVSDHILDRNPRSIVLIDSWGFMVRVAKRLKSKGYRGIIIKYVAPQVWAMRSGRANVLARYVDHLLSTQPMDGPYFEAAGLPLSYVGNAVFDRDYRAGDAKAFRARHQLGSAPLIGVFFGSRPSEIDRIGADILRNAQTVKSSIPNARLVFSIAEPVREAVEALIKDVDGVAIGSDEMIDMFPALRGAVACSGTITSQLAAAGVPTTVLYKLQPLTFLMARHLFKPDHISLVNIAAGKTLMPEFMQGDVESDRPAQALLAIIRDERRRSEAATQLIEQSKMMAAATSASDAAAAKILELLNA